MLHLTVLIPATLVSAISPRRVPFISFIKGVAREIDAHAVNMRLTLSFADTLIISSLFLQYYMLYVYSASL